MLERPSVQHADLPRVREILELIEQACLADPGLAPYQDELTLAGDGRVEPMLQAAPAPSAGR